MSGSFEEELAKAAGQVVIDTAGDARKALSAIFGDVVSEFGASLGDRMKLWRFRNLTRIFEEVDEIARSRNVPPEAFKVLPFGDAVRAIESASFEEDAEVQRLWARLIANAAIGDSGVRIEKPFVDILKSLSASDAALLELLDACERASRSFRTVEELKKFNVDMNSLAEQKWRKYSSDNRGASVQNLTRLRCVTFRPRPIDASGLLAELPDRSGSYRKWSAVDPTKLQKVLQEIVELGFAAAGVQEYRTKPTLPLHTPFGSPWGGHVIEIAEMNFQLTPLGRSLMTACRHGKE